MNRFLLNLRALSAPSPEQSAMNASQLSVPGLRFRESFLGNIGEELVGCKENDAATPEDDEPETALRQLGSVNEGEIVRPYFLLSDLSHSERVYFYRLKREEF